MLISFNYETATTTASKSMGFDPSPIQSCLVMLLKVGYLGKANQVRQTSYAIWLGFKGKTNQVKG